MLKYKAYKVMGVDLSLRNTGCAFVEGDGSCANWLGSSLITPKDLRGFPRLIAIVNALASYAAANLPDLVAFEDIFMGPGKRAAADTNAVLGAARYHLYHRFGLSSIVIHPVRLRSFVKPVRKLTDKDIMDFITKEFPGHPANEHEADAGVLAVMGLHWLFLKGGYASSLEPRRKDILKRPKYDFY